MMRGKLSVVLVALIALAAVACERKGAAERAGEKVDHAVDTMKNGGEEPAADKIQDSADKVRDKAADATEKAEGK